LKTLLEAEAGIEPTNGGFAIRGITTLLLGRFKIDPLINSMFSQPVKRCFTYLMQFSNH
jgi:hypothetical protein